MVQFAIDIDQTLCGENAHSVYARFYNKDLQLGLDDEVLQHLTTYQEFIDVFKGSGICSPDKRSWYASRRRAIETPEVLSSFLPMDGASDGVKQLSCIGSVSYYTARSKHTYDVTQQWLDDYGFPGELWCCGSIENKLMMLARREEQYERIYLIDDRAHTHILNELEKFKENPDMMYLRQWLTLVAFGCDASTSTLPQTSLCSLLALPSWNAVDVFLAQIV